MGTIDLVIDRGIATVTINNPERRNAMTLAMWQSLGSTVIGLDTRQDVRLVVLRGAGERAFISGADIKEFEALRTDPESVARYDQAIAQAQAALMQCAKPTIASIAGACFGGGIGLAAACDLRYAASDARFCMPAARLGLGYAQDGMRRLVEVVGSVRAAELFYTARVFDGNEAARIGFVQAAYPADMLLSEVAAISARIAENAPLTVRAAKLAIGQILGHDGIDPGQVSMAVEQCFRSEDYREGQAAFKQKRDPVFHGR